MECMRQAAIERLRAQGHQDFGFYPTPLEAMDGLRRALGPAAPRLLIKRDDYTGFGLGGNKVRKLEYELAPEIVRGADLLITAGGTGSNHARVTAAAAARLGLECVLVLNGAPPEPPRGNAFLQRLFGARIESVGSRPERATRMQEIAADAARRGQRAIVVPLGASTPQGALGYVRAGLELGEQLRTLPPAAGKSWLFLSASSGGTLAGLLVGLQLAQLDAIQIVGVSPDDPGPEIAQTAITIGRAAGQLIGYQLELRAGQPIVLDDYVGAGYGIPTRDSQHAIELFAHTEGIVLDPVYSAKAAAGLIDWIEQRRIAPDDTVIFWHTGGHPALFT